MSAKQYVDLNGITVYDEEIKDYIDEQGFVVGSGTNGSLAKFNNLGELTDGATLGNDTTKYLRNDGTWAVPPGTGGISSIGDIPDVSIVSPSNGQTFSYNSTAQEWENKTLYSWSSVESCLVDDTTCTIQDGNIHTTSIIEAYMQNTSETEIPVEYTTTEGQVVLSFTALTEATDFRVKITNL